MVIPQPFNPTLDAEISIDRNGEIESMPMARKELYIGEVEDMADVIIDGRSPSVSLEDSRNNINLILALLRSAELGKPVLLS